MACLGRETDYDSNSMGRFTILTWTNQAATANGVLDDETAQEMAALPLRLTLLLRNLV
jgi:hypothetical protein